MADASERDWDAVREQNRQSWNVATNRHNAHKRDQAAFLKAGGSTLFDEERALLGVTPGERIAHLQCNAGQDSLSWVQLGAQVVGVDLCDEAVAFARALSAASGLPATFEQADILEWMEATKGGFDHAVATYGCIGWIQDLDRWMRGVYRTLKPGGKLTLLEFHPVAWSLGPAGLCGDPYFIEGPITEPDGVSDYVGAALAPSGFVEVDSPYRNPHHAICFQHGVGAIVQAVVRAGLQLERVEEYPYANGCEIWKGMKALPGNRFTVPDGWPSMPLMLGVSARRPG